MDVSELVASAWLGLRVVHDGGLDCAITSVQVAELPDPRPYLQRGDLVLTAGVWRSASMTSANAFVERVATCQPAAIGFGLTPACPEVPDDILVACRTQGVTLLAVPQEVPFAAVLRAFIDDLMRQREAPLLRANRRNERYVSAIARGEGIDALLRILAQDCPYLLFVRKSSGRPENVVLPDGEEERLVDISSRLQAIPLAGRDIHHLGDATVFPILAVGRTEAFLVVGASVDELSLEQRSTIDQAVAFLGLDFARQRALREIERRLATELVEVVMSGPAEPVATASRLRALGLDPQCPIITAWCNVARADECIVEMEHALGTMSSRCVVAVRGRGVIMLAQSSVTELDLSGVAELLHDAIASRGAVGVGPMCVTASGLRKSLIGASHACKIAGGRAVGSQWATYDEVGSHGLLLALQDEDIVASFQRGLIDPLMSYDNDHQAQLVLTLDTFLESGCRWQQTADALHIHVNTLRHRLRRIQDLTGRDLAVMGDRVDFFLALRSRKLEYVRD